MRVEVCRNATRELMVYCAVCGELIVELPHGNNTIDIHTFAKDHPHACGRKSAS